MINSSVLRGSDSGFPLSHKPRCLLFRAQIAADKEKIERLRRWLHKMGHEEWNLKLERQPTGSGVPGYRMVAGSGGIKKGEVAVKVPLQALMTEETAFSCPYVGPFIRSRPEITSWQAMCLHLLCERARCSESPWHAYIALLPTESEMTGGHPMLWPEGLRKEWLAGSLMLLKVESRLQQCREDYMTMLAAGVSQMIPAGPGSGGFVTEAAVRWAATILLSRAFSLDLHEQGTPFWNDNGPSIALVPWADMLNHSSLAGKESCLKYDYGSKFACLYAHKTYAEGEQVYDSYGPILSPAQLLIDYGFVDDDNSNHAIELPVTLLGPVKGKANEDLLNAVGFPFGEAVFSVTQLGADQSILTWTRAAVASTKELADAGWIGGACSSIGASSAMACFCQPVSKENELEVLMRLFRVCERMLKQYSVMLEEDVANLALSDGLEEKRAPLLWAKKQALRACVSEKLALEGTSQVVWEILKKLHSDLPLNLLYS